MLESAALLVWRRGPSGPEILLGHPGGPYWRGKDAGAWTLPKGLIEPGETSAAAAKREFIEETGLVPPSPQEALTPRRITRAKRLTAWLAEADLDLSGFTSNPIEIPWPPRSGRTVRFPELDALAYFPEPEALRKIARGQADMLLEALEVIRARQGAHRSDQFP